MKTNTIKVLGQGAAKTLSKAKFFASMHAPEALVVTGVVGFVGTCVLVAKGAKKYEEVKDDSSDTKAEKTRKAVICYAPAGIVGGLTLSCFTGGHYILKKRNLGLVAAYKVVDDSFKKYRAAVIEKYGEEEDYRLKNGIRIEKESITEVDEDGKKHKKKVDVEYIDGEPSGYSYIYDNEHILYGNDYTAVMLRDKLVTAENSANVLLRAQGYLMLNDVLEAIGLPKESVGQIVGWRADGDGDGFVDFRTKMIRTNKDDDGPAFLLDFNVDGPIYDDIDKYTKKRY